MSRSLLWRIAAPFIALILAAQLGLSYYFSNRLEKNYFSDLQNGLRTEGALLVYEVQPYLNSDPDAAEMKQIVRRYGETTGRRWTVIHSTGRVLAETDVQPDIMDNHLARPEVQIALNTGEGQEIRFSDTLKERFLYLAIAVRDGGDVVGFVRGAYSLAEIEARLESYRRMIFSAGLLMAAMIILLSMFVAERTIRPLKVLANQVSQLGAGNYQIEVSGRRDEVGTLTQSFARMALQLKTQIEDFKAERGKLEAVLRHITDAILIVDVDGRVTLMNPAAERIFSSSSTDAMNKSLIETVRNHQIVELWRNSLETGIQQMVTLETTPERLVVQGIATPLSESLPGSTMLVFQDLTRVRKLETVRRDFVSNVSHELRTPLASLKALTETLQDGALEDPPAARNFLQRMEVEIDNMTQLVRELLELSKIESGKFPFNFQRVNPRQLVANVSERMRLQADRAGLSLIEDYPQELPDVQADADRIEQVLVNLIHNAIKFTQPGGKITVVAWQEDDKVVFAVRDTGVGIERDALGRIFERFYKADQSRSGGGTGLGLSIARHTVQAHKGQIWAESVLDEGSTFYFSLPLA